MRDAFVNRLSQLAANDRRIMLLTGDLGFGVLTAFADTFPAQYLNVGVAEQNMTGVATGLALEGRTVFTYSIGNFPTLRCLEQIRNDAAYHHANVKIVAVGAGFSYGPLGVSHHATEDIAIMRSLPVVVSVPACDWEASEATSAIASVEGTCYLRLDKSGASSTRKPDEQFKLGKARVVREGFDVTVITAGGILTEVLDAAEKLSTEGIDCRVISMHTIKPIDAEAISLASYETDGVVTVEEHTVFGGLGSAVAECLLESGALPRVYVRLGIRDGLPSDIGSQEYLRRRNGLDANGIAEGIRKALQTKKGRQQAAGNAATALRSDKPAS
jgi:transketolase